MAKGHTATSANAKEETMKDSKVKIVYVINERDGRNYWNRVGVAFVNRDGSLNVKLDAIPVNGEMQIRDYVPREDSASSSPSARRSNGESAYVELS
ncbi:MAG TPA: hypothetical protein PKA88_05835 [Polyangiaceae bacterium]|nr:hypothetical protein [Polyangiaceae bacterium]